MLQTHDIRMKYLHTEHHIFFDDFMKSSIVRSKRCRFSTGDEGTAWLKRSRQFSLPVCCPVDSAAGKVPDIPIYGNSRALKFVPCIRIASLSICAPSSPPAVLAAGCHPTRNTISTIYPARRLQMIKFIRSQKRAVVSEREFRHGSSRPKSVERSS